MKKKTIFNYFDEEIEFPKKDAVDTPIPYGILYHYIGSSYLNGFINLVEPISFYLIDRYTDENHKKDIDILKTKLNNYHTELNCFDDDIIILAKIYTNKYIFFYFDQDVSDCSIGKFETFDSIEEIKSSITDWLDIKVLEYTTNNRKFEENCDNGIFGYTELPITYLEGWLKF